MSDRNLSSGELAKILRAYGFSIKIEDSFLIAYKQGDRVGWKIYLDKIEGDKLWKYVISVLRKRLGLLPENGVTDKDFYSKL